jgi:HK97 family phage prohead protease
MEEKTFPLRLKALGDTGSFTGMASSYGVEPDLVGDTVRRGAFAKAIQSQGSGLPILWQHDPRSPIGKGVISDSPNGLMVDGQLLMSDATARKAYEFLKAGIIKGLSIGFDALQSVDREDGGRELTEIRLWEISCVTFPANLNANVTAVKSLGGVLPVLSALTRVDLNDGPTLDELRAIRGQLGRLLPDDEDDGDDEEDDDIERLLQLRAIDAALKLALG